MYIDPLFSIYDIVDKSHPSNIFLTTSQHLLLFSQGIEQEIVNHRSCSPVYVGIQHFVNLAPIIDTYKRIAKFAEIVYLFGVVDVDLPVIDHPIHFVPIQPDSNLAKEWFMLVDHPNYTKLLSARERPAETKELDQQRIFEGVLSSERKIVRDTITALSSQMGSARRRARFQSP
jgi:hypothetical protein